MPRPRILLDVTTLIRVPGQGDGITRTLWNLTRYALDHLPDVQFVFLAPEPFYVDRQWLHHHLAGTHLIDVSDFADPGAKPRLRERVPSLKPLLLWVQRPRRQMLLLTERGILKDGRFAPFARRIKPHVIYGKYRRILARPDGTFGHIIPREMALRAMEPYTKDDTLIFAGSEWAGMEQTLASAAQKPKVAALCYDAIPLLFPNFYPAGFVSAFRRCVMEVYAKADLMIFSAHQIVQDTELLCGHLLRRVAVIKLGSDLSLSSEASTASVPHGLASNQFALFVSTLEPRKGHRTLFEVWKKLLDEGVPQKHDFKLVFVGRKGWMVDDLIADMRAHPSFGDSLIWLDNADDATLATLYDHCAFTLYPSLYEGFGLPIMESFRQGKAVIASGAGALRETVNGFSPCLDPTDRDAWVAQLREWITTPAAYRKYETMIRSEFQATSWPSAAESFFRAIDASFSLGIFNEISTPPQTPIGSQKTSHSQS